MHLPSRWTGVRLCSVNESLLSAPCRKEKAFSVAGARLLQGGSAWSIAALETGTEPTEGHCSA